MTGWVPPPKSVVMFGIGGLNVSGPVSYQAWMKAVQAVHSRFKLPFKEHEHCKLPLRDPRWPELLDFLERDAAAVGLSLQGMSGAAWVEEPEPGLDDPAAWFDLQCGPTEFKSAARTPAGEHLLFSSTGRVASQTFIDGVARLGLTGLESLPVPSTKPSDPVRWHQIFAAQPMGRGLDHALIDSEAKTQLDSKGNRSMIARRRGEPTAWLEKGFRLGIADPIIERLMAIAPRHTFSVRGPARYIAERLPRTDFAYRTWAYRTDEPVGPRGRGLSDVVCNGRARAALIGAGLMKPQRFTPIAVIPAAEADNVILDDIISEPLPLPVFTPEEAAAERARRQAVIRIAEPDRPALRFGSLEEAESYLRGRLSSGTATWPAAGAEASFEGIADSELFGRTPMAWQRLAPLLPLAFCTEDDEFEFEMTEPEWNTWLGGSMDGRDAAEAPAEIDLVIATSPNGDWFAFREGDPGLPGDARIVYWDHETTCIKDEWPSVLAFAAHLVGLCDHPPLGDE